MSDVSDWLATAERFIDDGDPRGARACAHEILELDEKSADGWALLAECELYLGSLDAAEEHARTAIEIDREHLRAQLVIGGVASERFALDIELPTLKAVADRARQLHDHKILFKAITWLSNGLYLAGEPSAAADCLLEASTLNPNRAPELYSKHLFYRNYRQTPSRDVAARFQSFFNHIDTINRTTVEHNKIRVGYISPDFRNHAVANFVVPFLKHFDAEHFQVYCYQTTKGDAVTARLKRNKVVWRNLIDKTPLESARSIANDHIDILIDLSGHTQNSCLPILAYKPAPVQITAIGYVGSTGLNAVDFFLSDKLSSPPSTDFTEQLLLMPDCHLCYSPIKNMPDVPAVEHQHITFGSFNNFAKISDHVLELWKAILDRVRHARLIIKSKTCSIPSGRAIVEQRLNHVGIDINRVELRPFSPDYLQQYADIDIALDAFPYNGGLTTCEALYMGVPVIALCGHTHADRIAASILNSARLNELIASTEDEYINKAVALANAPDRINHYRTTLRPSIEQSPLMDARLYICNFEAVIKNIGVK
ncbi:MAG: hypothetical protein IJ668_04065 [Selenomonadaceae bacterium]|nr:hypothetical protein [Selenomonadaceae bacterium]